MPKTAGPVALPGCIETVERALDAVVTALVGAGHLVFDGTATARGQLFNENVAVAVAGQYAHVFD